MECILYAVIEGGDTSEALTLLEASDVSEWINKPADFGLTCLMLACYNNNKAVVNKMLKVRNIDINKSGLSGITSLHIATYKKHTEIVELLLINESVCEMDVDNCTPLHLAAYNDDTDTLECLLKRSTLHINSITTGRSSYILTIYPPIGSTALHVAALYGNLNATKLFIKYGADVTIKAKGQTPYDMALKNHHQHVADYLKYLAAQKPPATDDLVLKVNQLEIECDQLQSQCNELKHKNSDLKSQCSELKGENSDIKTENMDLKTRISKLEQIVRPKTSNNSNNQSSQSQSDVQCIQNNFTYLLDHLCADDHLDYLYQERALTFEDYEDISGIIGNTKRTREMLRKLIRKSTSNPECIKVFRKSIEENVEYHLHIFN